MPKSFSAIIIGAGESGIAVGCMLKTKLGTDDFRIFDRQSGVGGAWYANRYPGVACDIPAIFYSYSFAPNYEWTTLFPPGQEIQQYLNGVCDKFGIRSNIQLNTEVSSARWIDEDAEWEVKVTYLDPRDKTPEEVTLRCKVLVTCAGELVEPNIWPQHVPGIESFQGQVFHTAQWKDEVSLTGKDVVTVPSRYHDMLTPHFGVGCRRIIVDCGWLESLSLPNVELTNRPLVSIEPQGVVLGPRPEEERLNSNDQKHHKEIIQKPADVILLANGFETSTYLHRLKVQGRNGTFLHDVWQANGGPGAYLSTAVHGFPNFFMVLGPNSVSGHSSAILASENVAGYALNFLKLVLSGQARTVEILLEAEQSYTADVQRRSLDKVWQTCHNGYIQKCGWNSSICP
ncbi:hypothetical protein CFIO01_06423 [Colletotrichum fioriniae PJ7]|uniref:Monooxygenase n=1 Tax=Colletotrichum fioriniae PJ7 TaxID=1445577 RepID=A0A010RFK0_9PEZI|nr:hypothetical protein CFIO01_06423 [Colletotrichum fioriniae PJ7]